MMYPVGTYLLLTPIQEAEQTAGGLYIPDAVRQEPSKGKIVSVGEEVKDEKLTEGTVVIFRKGVGEPIKYQGTEYLLLQLKEVIGILK